MGSPPKEAIQFTVVVAVFPSRCGERVATYPGQRLRATAPDAGRNFNAEPWKATAQNVERMPTSPGSHSIPGTHNFDLPWSAPAAGSAVPPPSGVQSR